MHKHQQDRLRTYNVKIRRVRVAIVAMEKRLSITYSEHVSVALGIQHAKRMRHIILSTVTCPARPHFSTLSHKQHATVHKMRVFFFNFLYNSRLKHLSF